MWHFVRERVLDAYQRHLSVVDACNEWYAGAYLMETLPSVLYILMRYGHDLEEALVRAVNDTRNNDTVAAIVGAALGALYGPPPFRRAGVAICLAASALTMTGICFSCWIRRDGCGWPRRALM